MKFVRELFLLTGACVLVAGCANTTFREVDVAPPRTLEYTLDEANLLDVGVTVFDSNIPQAYDDIVTENITPEVRRAEANYIANYAKDFLQSTGNWGAVRVLPEASQAVDVLVEGGILHSDGERQVLAVRVVDSRGEVWVETWYETLASKYNYDEDQQNRSDPFRKTYRLIANDMLDYMESLSNEEIQDIRNTTLMRHARELNPDAFENYVSVDTSGKYELIRLPSADDPNMRRVLQVLERYLLFVDFLDEYYSNFAANMERPYNSWRKATYSDALALRENRNKSRTRLIAGAMMVLGGAIMQRSSHTPTEYGGYSSVMGGATEILGGIQNLENVRMHASALHEFGVVAAREISPHTIELENSTISLQGTAQEQLGQLKTFLRKLYFEDLDLPVEDDDQAQESDTHNQASGEKVTEEFFQDDA
ncbi:MAG: hypothetical protein F4X44_11190 [Gammaproteobacteria bacterium]|nr:hypothetical protein [Gammaproteobacteria bacterium]MYD81162.1 hypothetical protein [Gammaproteobacteria bacterium]